MERITIKEEIIINNFISEDGELLEVDKEVKKHKIVVGDNKTFSMMYNTIIGLYDGLDKVAIKILTWCGVNAQHNTNIVNLTKPMCNLISKEYDLSYHTIKNAISRLAKKKALFALGSGTYRVNPKYYWKGSIDTRRKTMKYILEVECPECEAKDVLDTER